MTRTSKESSMILRQAYVDCDLDEFFFTCAFGGRSFGRPFGYKPMQDDNGRLFMGDLESYQRVIMMVASLSQSGNKRQARQQILCAMADTEKFDGPQLLCVASCTREIVKVIDTVQQLLLMTIERPWK
jgi:hypothetical protein